jgi:hypothetical protein
MRQASYRPWRLYLRIRSSVGSLNWSSKCYGTENMLVIFIFFGRSYIPKTEEGQENGLCEMHVEDLTLKKL